MHGLVLVELQKYLVARLGDEGWSHLLEEASIKPKSYEHIESYPDEEASALLDAASRIIGTSDRDLLYGFGESIAPSLMRLYKVLIEPEWKTLELIEQVETTIHQVVRFRNPEARPPEIRCERQASDQILVSYSPSRQLCALVVGIARGVAKGYGEEIDIRETSCALRGDAKCTITIKRIRSSSSIQLPEQISRWSEARCQPIRSGSPCLVRGGRRGGRFDRARGCGSGRRMRFGIPPGRRRAGQQDCLPRPAGTRSPRPAPGPSA